MLLIATKAPIRNATTTRIAVTGDHDETLVARAFTRSAKYRVYESEDDESCALRYRS
jgi:hypothetical protein